MSADASSSPAPVDATSSPKLGLFLDLRNPPSWRRPWAQHYQASLDLVTEAERLGAHSVWATEHHFFEDGYLPQPLTFLAAAAARTTRMRLGTAVVLAALRHPRHVAEEAAIVDLVSAGRLELGIGAGYRRAEYEAFGADIRRRMTLTDQATATIRDLLWSGELLPPTVQSRVPVWLGYQGPQGAKRAGRLGVGLLSLKPELLAPYQEGLTEAGLDPSSARMGGVVNLVVADDPERTAHELSPYYAYQLDSYARSRVEGTGEPAPPASDPGQLVEQMLHPDSPGLRVCTVDDSAAFIRALTAGLPVQHVYLWGSIAGMPEHIVERHLELAFGKVAPLI